MQTTEQSGLQAANSVRRERPNHHRTPALSWAPNHGRVADHPPRNGRTSYLMGISRRLLGHAEMLWAKNCEGRITVGKALLHIVNNADVFLKHLLRLKCDVEAIGRNVELAVGLRVKVVRIVEKRESVRSTRQS
jgi:hypothetical protein